MGLAVSLKKKVRGFSLDVEWSLEDEIAVLFGPSGSGKSMTLQLVAGLMTPDQGVVRSGSGILFDSSRKIDLPPFRRSFGYVFQDLALFPHMTVRENILYGAKGLEKDEREDRFHSMMGTFRLKGLENKSPSEISGGQKQRVAFARSLIRKPGALLLDEPFSALDSSVRTEMGNFLKDVQRLFRIPTVLVTHDVSEAYALADKMIVYSAGRIVQPDFPTRVFQKPDGRNVEEEPVAAAVHFFCHTGDNQS